MSYDPKVFSDRLLISRRDMNLGQKELGRRANVSNTYISDLERGRITNPGIEVIASLANALDVSIEYLIGLSDDPTGGEQSGERSLHLGDDYLAYEIHQEPLRKLTRQLIDIFLSLPPRDQALLVSMAQTVAEADQPRIIGSTE